MKLLTLLTVAMLLVTPALAGTTPMLDANPDVPDGAPLAILFNYEFGDMDWSYGTETTEPGSDISGWNAGLLVPVADWSTITVGVKHMSNQYRKSEHKVTTYSVGVRLYPIFR